MRKKYYGSIRKEIDAPDDDQSPITVDQYFISPEMLHEYESVCEGSASVIADIIVQEQKHQHRKELCAEVLSSCSHILGQLFAVLLIFLVVIASIYLTISGYILSSVVIMVSCALIVFAFSAVAIVRDLPEYKKIFGDDHIKQNAKHNIQSKPTTSRGNRSRIRSNASNWKKKRSSGSSSSNNRSR